MKMSSISSIFTGGFVYFGSAFSYIVSYPLLAFLGLVFGSLLCCGGFICFSFEFKKHKYAEEIINDDSDSEVYI